MAIEVDVEWHADDADASNADFHGLSLETQLALPMTSNQFNSKPVTNLPVNQ